MSGEFYEICVWHQHLVIIMQKMFDFYVLQQLIEVCMKIPNILLPMTIWDLQQAHF